MPAREQAREERRHREDAGQERHRLDGPPAAQVAARGLQHPHHDRRAGEGEQQPGGPAEHPHPAPAPLARGVALSRAPLQALLGLLDLLPRLHASAFDAVPRRSCVHVTRRARKGRGPAADRGGMDETWAYLEGRRAGCAYHAFIRTPLDPQPEFDHHVAIALGHAPHWRTGLPKEKELTRLQDLEDRLTASLDGHGVHVASETTDATRTVHLFIRGGGELADYVAGHGRRGSVTMSIAHDPDWSAVAHIAASVQRAA